MSDPANDVRDPWAPYQPTADAPWDLRRVVHLHRRAGFAATPAELERDLAEGPEASVGRLLEGHVRGPHDAEFERTAAAIAEAAVDSRDPERLKAWWLFRMLMGPDPLGERITLMWHDHFATSNEKVDDLAAMRRQNDLFRAHARAPFGELLQAAVRDPALLVWLDAPANRKGHPNENLARELLELFTLGISHYTEVDVKEAARALTGWTVSDGAFVENPAAHDAGVKVLLGETARWDGSRLMGRLLDHPATADRLAGRLCTLFMGEGAIDPDGVAALAAGLRARGLDVGWAVATVLRSQAFFAAANVRSRVLGPVEFVVGAARALECLDPPPSTLLLAGWVARMGQDLFYPPNVGGWPGGRAWLSSRGLVARANFATALVEGRGVGRPGPLDVLALAGAGGPAGDLDAVVDVLSGRLFGSEPEPGWCARIVAAASRGAGPPPDAARRAAALVLSSPEAQLA
jgi:uncharacterized protein (DUF1800 family)